MSSKSSVRKGRIVEMTRSGAQVSIDALARTFDVSPQTIRRDINALCDANILRRRHGGAEIMVAPVNTAYDDRRILNVRAKEQIGAAVAEMVPDGATVFLSIGTTPAVVAQALRRRANLTVVTNNLNAAMALSEVASNRIILPGGEVRLPDRDILGRSASTVFERHRADFGIYGVGGIDDDGALLDFHQPEIEAREAIRRNARRSILVADCSKFGRTAPAIGGMLGEADHIVTDSRPDARFAPLVERLGDRVIIASEVGQ